MSDFNTDLADKLYNNLSKASRISARVESAEDCEFQPTITLRLF